MVCLFVLSAVFCLAGVASATGSLPSGNGNPGPLYGTWGFSFVGAFKADHAPGSGNGTFVLDGKGNVTGGAVHCNIEGVQTDAKITGGKYSVSTDGSGYMTINTNSQFCDTGIDGIDLKFSIVDNNDKILFSSDGSDNFYNTGNLLPLTGEADPLH